MKKAAGEERALTALRSLAAVSLFGMAMPNTAATSVEGEAHAAGVDNILLGAEVAARLAAGATALRLEVDMVTCTQ